MQRGNFKNFYKTSQCISNGFVVFVHFKSNAMKKLIVNVIAATIVATTLTALFTSCEKEAKTSSTGSLSAELKAENQSVMVSTMTHYLDGVLNADTTGLSATEWISVVRKDTVFYFTKDDPFYNFCSSRYPLVYSNISRC